MLLWQNLVSSWHLLQSWWISRVEELAATPIDSIEVNFAFWNVLIPLATAAIGAYSARKSAKEQERIAEEARKGTTTTQTSIPYMNEYIARLIPYILSEQQKIYESRLKGYGLKPGDFSPIAAMLAGISPSYSGVGLGAGGVLGQGGVPGLQGSGMPGYSPIQQFTAEDKKKIEDYAKENGVSLREAEKVLYGGVDRNLGMGTYGLNDRRGFDTGTGNPFGPAGFTGVKAGDARGAGDWLMDQLKGGFGGGIMSNLFGLGEWGTSEKKAVY